MGMIAKTISTIGKSGLNGGDVINGVMAISDFKNAREEGNGVVKSAAKAGISFAWGELFYGGLNDAVTAGVKAGLKSVGIKESAAGILGMPITMGVMLAPAAAQLAGANMQHTGQVKSNMYRQKGKLGSGYFNMTDTGYTMRQRSLNAIRSNGLNTQSVLGNEARTYFRS